MHNALHGQRALGKSIPLYSKLALVSVKQITHCLNLFDFIRLLWGLNSPSPLLLAGAHLGFKDSDEKLQL